MKAIGSAILLALASGCAGSRSVTADAWQPQKLTDLVSRLVPVGTPVDEAQRVMEREGFKCNRVTNTEFFASVHDEERGDHEESREGLDFVSCYLSSRSFMVSSEKNVALVYRDGKVVEVLTNVRHYGP